MAWRWAQAQHAIKELMEALEERGVDMKFAIHPVAGRMPGHMNVLLAEADIPYDHVLEMDEINPEFAATDVALVVGANDVHQSGRQGRPGKPHLRYAHSGRGESASGVRHQAQHAARLRGRRQSAVLPRQLLTGVW